MAKKSVKKQVEKATEIHLEIPSENLEECSEVYIKSGDEIIQHFSLHSSDKFSHNYISKKKEGLKIELIDSATKTARIVLGGFNNGANRGRISYKIGEKKPSAEK